MSDLIKKETLIDLTSGIADLMFRLDEQTMNGEEPSEELMEQVNELVTKQADKVDRCVNFINFCQAQINWFNEEKKHLDAQIKTMERSQERLKTLAGYVMEREGTKELVGLKGHKFSFRSSQSINIKCPIEELPGKYLVTKTETIPDKNLLKADIKSGVVIPGVTLDTKKNVQSK